MRKGKTFLGRGFSDSSSVFIFFNRNLISFNRLGKILLFLSLMMRNLVFSGLSGAEENPELLLIKTIITANPKDVSAWNSYGIEQAKMGDLNGAIQTWRKAVEISPTYIHLHNNIGSALRRLGYLKEASDWYLFSIKTKPTYWTYYNLGLLYEDLKNKKDAVISFQRAIDLCPNFSLAEEHMLRLKRELDSSAASTRPMLSQDSKAPPPLTIKLPVDFPQIPLSPPRTKENSPRGAPEKPLSKPLREPIPPVKTVLQQESGGFQISPPKRIPADKGGMVFFTFDGGADANGIPGILNALRERQIKSTFFLTGNWVQSYPDLAIQILAEGHEIGNHSMSHKNMKGWGKDQIAQELKKAEEVFQRVLGRFAIKYFRFPFGAQNSRVEGFINELGYHPVYWDIDTLDWQEPSVSSIISKVRSKLKSGAVILMHCGSKKGSTALPFVLDEAISRGYKPATLTSLSPQQIAAISFK